MSEYLQGHNLYNFIKILLATLIISFPVGYGLTRTYCRNKNRLSTVLTGLGLGLPLTATIWSLMAWLAIPFTPLVYMGAALVCGLGLFFILGKSNRPIYREGRAASEVYSHIGLVVIIFALSFLLGSVYLINLKIPPVLDGQLHGFIQMLLKHTGAYHPLLVYPDKIPLPNFYPPGFHVISTMNSMLTGSSLATTLMGTGIACYVVLCLFIFEALYSLTSRLWIASVGVGMLFCRGMIGLLLQSQYPEVLAITACAAFMFIFLMVLEGDSRKNVLLAGVLLGATGVIHTRFYFWLTSALVVYILSRYLARPSPTRQDQGNLVIILILGFLLNIPQFLINSQKFSGPAAIYTHYLLSIKPHLFDYHGWPMTLLVFLAMVFFMMKRDRKSIFLLSWIVVIFINIDYWRVLEFISPSWFSITPHIAPVKGVWSVFSDIFFFAEPFAAVLYGLFPVFPIAVALGICTAVGGYTPGFWEKFKYHRFFSIALVVILIAGFVYNELKPLKTPYAALAEADIQVLEELRKNSRFDEVLIFNPPGILSFWAPVIAERRALLFRRTELFYYEDPPYTRAEMGVIFNDIKRHYQFLKENRITHIYVPGSYKNKFEQNGIPDFLSPQFLAKDSTIYRVL